MFLAAFISVWLVGDERIGGEGAGKLQVAHSVL